LDAPRVRQKAPTREFRSESPNLDNSEGSFLRTQKIAQEAHKDLLGRLITQPFGAGEKKLAPIWNPLVNR
jgi:hypothetical protein